MPQAGAPKKGERRGGRQPGTPNRRTVETSKLIEQTLGASPLEKMARLARELLDGKHKLHKPMVVDKVLRLIPDRGFELRLAADLLMDVAQYHSPKRKALEISDSEGRPVSFEMIIQ